MQLMTSQRVRLFVSGRVQGVFFRQTLRVMARKNNVHGWVRNLRDGRVEAVVEGEYHDVSHIVEWCHAGPASAEVDDLEIRNEEYTGEYSEFEVLY
jgi:acylphosphatase